MRPLAAQLTVFLVTGTPGCEQRCRPQAAGGAQAHHPHSKTDAGELPGEPAVAGQSTAADHGCQPGCHPSSTHPRARPGKIAVSFTALFTKVGGADRVSVSRGTLKRSVLGTNRQTSCLPWRVSSPVNAYYLLSSGCKRRKGPETRIICTCTYDGLLQAMCL